MIGRGALHLFVFAMAATAVPASAHAWDAESTSQQLYSRHIVYGFASCVAGEGPKYASALLEARPTSLEEATAFKTVTDKFEYCLPSQHDMKMIGGTLRGTLAEELYKRRYHKPTSVAARPMDLDYQQFGDSLFSAPMPNVHIRSNALMSAYWLGYCAAHENPNAVDQLLFSSPDTSRENEALANLSPTLSDCMARGHDVAMSRVTVRAFLAEGLYRFRLDNEERL